MFSYDKTKCFHLCLDIKGQKVIRIFIVMLLSVGDVYSYPDMMINVKQHELRACYISIYPTKLLI